MSQPNEKELVSLFFSSPIVKRTLNDLIKLATDLIPRQATPFSITGTSTTDDGRIVSVTLVLDGVMLMLEPGPPPSIDDVLGKKDGLPN